MEADDHDIIRERASRESRPCAPRHKWQMTLGEKPHDCYCLVARAGKNREAWLAAIARQTVGIIDQKLARPLQDMTRADYLGETLGDLC